MAPPPPNTLETGFKYFCRNTFNILIKSCFFKDVKQQLIKSKKEKNSLITIHPEMANGHVHFLQNVHNKVEHVKNTFFLLWDGSTLQFVFLFTSQDCVSFFLSSGLKIASVEPFTGKSSNAYFLLRSFRHPSPPPLSLLLHSHPASFCSCGLIRAQSGRSSL